MMEQQHEYAVQLATSNIRFGPGVTRELGDDLVDAGVRRALLVTDGNVAKLAPVAVARQSMEDAGVEHDVYAGVRIEPTDQSFQEAIAVARDGGYDGFVAIGGGSAMDTAKAANLYSAYPAPFLDYVNPPLGAGKPVPGPVKPLIAVPTTSGTGSETTGVAIFDYMELHAKTGIAHRRLKPTLGLLDPENLRTLPASVTAATGLDVLSHAIESFTAIPYRERPRPESPILRPAYQGSNPISDIWALESLRMVDRYLVRAANDAEDQEARGQMLLAAAYAGVGFGNAGVHLPHGMSYPVSSMVGDYRPEGYAVDRNIVPHGFSVILNAPAVFRFTAKAAPKRHLAAAEALGADVHGVAASDAGKVLSDRITEFMEALAVPNGLRAVGYGAEDIPKLVEGTLPQHRVTKLSPLAATAEDLAALFEDALDAY